MSTNEPLLTMSGCRSEVMRRAWSDVQEQMSHGSQITNEDFAKIVKQHWTQVKREIDVVKQKTALAQLVEKTVAKEDCCSGTGQISFTNKQASDRGQKRSMQLLIHNKQLEDILSKLSEVEREQLISRSVALLLAAQSRTNQDLLSPETKIRIWVKQMPVVVST